MITLEQAKSMFEEMIKNSSEAYRLDQVSELALDDPIYVMIALDKEGNQIFPGEVFPSIRKSDGATVNFAFPAIG